MTFSSTFFVTFMYQKPVSLNKNHPMVYKSVCVWKRHTDTFAIVVLPSVWPFLLRQCETCCPCCFFLHNLCFSHFCPFLCLCLSIFASLQVLVAFISFSETMLLVYLSYKVSQTIHVPMVLSLECYETLLASKRFVIPGESCLYLLAFPFIIMLAASPF